jgi:hypothetical protein
MKHFLAVFLIFGLYFHDNNAYSQESLNKEVKIESYFNMENSLGLLFCGKFNPLIYQAAIQGKIPVFKTSNLKPDEKLNKEQIILQGGIKYNIRMLNPNDPSGETLVDTFVIHKFCIDYNMGGYYFSINWQLALDGYSYFGIPTAFALAYNSTQFSDTVKMLPLFWINYDDLKSIIDIQEFHKLQEALFLHLFTKFHSQHDVTYPDGIKFLEYPKDSNTINNVDIRTSSTKNLLFNTRLFCDLDPKEWDSLNKRIDYDARKGFVTVYRSDSMQFGEIFPREWISNWGDNEEIAQLFPCPKILDSIIGYYNLNDIKSKMLIFTDTSCIDIITQDTIKDTCCYGLRIPFDHYEPDDYSVSEKWEMDYNKNKITGHINGISLDDYQFWHGQFRGKDPNFFITYKYIESIIGKDELNKMSNKIFYSLINNYLKKSTKTNIKNLD